MKKKILSLLLVVSMCLSMCMMAFAENTNREVRKETLTSAQLQVYTADMEAFERTTIDSELLTISFVDESNKFTYQFNISDTKKNYIQIEYTSETVTLDVYEDGRHNTMEYLSGGIKIDGELYETTSTQTRARASEYLSSPPPGYTSGTYSYSHTKQDNNFSLKRSLATYTTAALCTILGVALFPSMGYTASVVYSFIGLSVDRLVQYAISNPTAGNNTYMSYKIAYYEHEDSMSIDRVYRCTAYFYPVTGCSGSPVSSSVYYYHNYFF